MSKITVIIAVCVVVFILLWLSYGGDGALPDTEASGGITPDVTKYGDNNFYYLVDNRTDVVYLVYNDVYRCGITVMVNSDGTPVTRDQIGLNYIPTNDFSEMLLPAS